ncbi:LysR family transcriptional regulator [Diaphorobacter caeni]|uniref:LysR family transcriptional regulator n=1 Tax=Diaphorobacter caeni TaxID=2784387 RepID=UPI00188E7063|nr:LysR family transcriptional regulator [Diaphorobacter caeni]MBF5007105.1 LysR family transcriptional regulator [Diaphorobacter caeni]
MTLKQLEAFYWAASLGSFAAASARLHVTQSSLSKRISELELSLGHVLFNRLGQRATLSDAGAQLLPYAARMLEIEDQARAALGDVVPLQGLCRFGVSELVASTWLPRFVKRVNLAFPQLTLEPHVDLTRGLERKVERGDLDFAVIPGPSRSAALLNYPVAELEYAWMSAPYLLSAGTLLTARHFQEHPVITLPAESTLRHTFERWAENARLTIPRALVCNSLLALIAMTMGGVGISFFPLTCVRPLLKAGSLVQLRCEPALPNLSYCIHWRRDDIRHVVHQLKNLIAEEADFSMPGVMPAGPSIFGKHGGAD